MPPPVAPTTPPSPRHRPSRPPEAHVTREKSGGGALSSSSGGSRWARPLDPPRVSHRCGRHSVAARSRGSRSSSAPAGSNDRAVHEHVRGGSFGGGWEVVCDTRHDTMRGCVEDVQGGRPKLKQELVLWWPIVKSLVRHARGGRGIVARRKLWCDVVWVVVRLQLMRQKEA